jgi:hypothetical protein
VIREGALQTEWWTPELDLFLEFLGVPETDMSRNPFCG